MSMAGYTKLFNSILASTIWREDDKTRIVWITLLAMADKNGVAEGSVPGLADLARVTIPECEASLTKLMSADAYSRTTDHEGKRIAKVEGGWAILNHAKYRAKMNLDERREYNRIKQKEFRQKKASTRRQQKSITVIDCNGTSALSAHAEASPESKAVSKTSLVDKLSSDPAYEGIDVKREMEKARVWCETNHRNLTERFFVNWLNKADRTIPINGRSKSAQRQMTPEELQFVQNNLEHLDRTNGTH